MGEVLYTGSWDKTIRVWNIEVRTFDAMIDVDTGMSLYARRTYGFCQVVDTRFASGAAVIRVYRCVIEGVVNQRPKAIAHTQGSFSSG